jgi:ribosomal protein L35
MACFFDLYINMPKIKTHKATSKRFTKTAKDKVKHRKGGQGHFNSRESGNTTRKKRRDVDATKTLVKTIKKLTPYN